MAESTPTTERTGRLTPDQVDQFKRDGYIQYHQPVLSPDKFNRLRAIFEEDLARYGADDLDVIHLRDERLLEFLLDDDVLDLVEPVMGPNIGLFSSHFISKPPRVGKATPWHEDSAYWSKRVSIMSGICTVWLAIDRATPENGSMGVIPGTHNNGMSAYEDVDESKNIFGARVVASQMDESKAVYFTLEPNECSLHEARIIHGAQANTSDTRRAGYTMRYFPTTSKIFLEGHEGRNLWLARGKDLAGNKFING